MNPARKDKPLAFLFAFLAQVTLRSFGRVRGSGALTIHRCVRRAGPLAFLFVVS